jgi:hypothetical protein
MGTITKTKTWADAETVNYTDLNSDFDTLYNEVNGNLDNDNLDASAGIAVTKISGTAVNLSSAQTIASVKTFDEGAIVTAPKAYSPAGAGTATLDLSLGNDFEITMPAGNITIALSNATVGQKFTISILQDATGSRTVTWFTTIRWVGGVAPTLTTTASKRDYFGFKVTGSGTYDGFVIGQNI